VNSFVDKLFPRQRENKQYWKRRFLCGPRRDYITRTSSSVVVSVENAVVRSEKLVAEAGAVREHRGRGTFAVGSRHQARANED
jgi:hypothetical protein